VTGLAAAAASLADVASRLRRLRESTSVQWAWLGVRRGDDVVSPLVADGLQSVLLKDVTLQEPLRLGLANEGLWVHRGGPISCGLADCCRLVCSAAARFHGFQVVVVLADEQLRSDGDLILSSLSAALPELGAALHPWLDAEQKVLDYRNLLETLKETHVGVWRFDPHSNRVDWTDALFETWGIEPAKFNHTYDAYNAGLHPADVEEVNRTIMQAMTRAQAEGTVDYVVEHRVVRPGGSLRHIEGRGRVSTDGRGRVQALSGVGIDITQRKQQQAQLVESEMRYLLFSQLASDFVYEAAIGAPAPTIIAGSLERTCGLTAAQLEAAGGWAGVVHPEDAFALARKGESLAAGRPCTIDFRIFDAGGEVRWLKERCLPMSEGRYMGGLSDVTTQRRLEEQLAHAQKLEALARMAGGVAHDFNNILTVLMSSLELVRMQSAKLPTLVNEAVEEMANAAQRGADLTRSLLAFARKSVNATGVVDLTATTQAMRALVARATGNSIKVAVVGPPSVHVRVDVGQLQLVVLNLALNARDAMPQGGKLVLSVSQRRFVASDEARPPELTPGDYAALEVTDTGSGMPPEVVARLFEPFFTTKGAEGTGLGLATSYGAIRQLGGAIVVHSELGHGTTFTIYLPAQPGEGAQSVSPRAQEVVVLVEDEPLIRRMASRALVQHGFIVIAAESGEEGQRVMKAHPEARVLLSDVMLPGLDGIALADWAKAEKPHLKVLLMSGVIGVTQPSPGRYPLLPKPFTPDGLARKIRELLDAS
jgi:two-component system, cell cycle sensor histidine kinase and response regulator CckA